MKRFFSKPPETIRQEGLSRPDLNTDLVLPAPASCPCFFPIAYTPAKRYFWVLFLRNAEGYCERILFPKGLTRRIMSGMKRLYLVRHAKSSWKNPDLSDFDRPLNKRGKRDAPLMGEYLKNNREAPELIISSPARRALKTAKIIAKEIGLSPKRILTNETLYLADVPTLVTIIRQIEDSLDAVMLFGHNPGLTMLANYLTDHPVENIPTCGVFCIEFAANSWREISAGGGSVVFFHYPRKNH